jgi:hypothetical protein
MKTWLIGTLSALLAVGSLTGCTTRDSGARGGGPQPIPDNAGFNSGAFGGETFGAPREPGTTGTRTSGNSDYERATRTEREESRK